MRVELPTQTFQRMALEREFQRHAVLAQAREPYRMRVAHMRNAWVVVEVCIGLLVLAWIVLGR